MTKTEAFTCGCSIAKGISETHLCVSTQVGICDPIFTAFWGFLCGESGHSGPSSCMASHPLADFLICMNPSSTSQPKRDGSFPREVAFPREVKGLLLPVTAGFTCSSFCLLCQYAQRAHVGAACQPFLGAPKQAGIRFCPNTGIWER